MFVVENIVPSIVASDVPPAPLRDLGNVKSATKLELKTIVVDDPHTVKSIELDIIELYDIDGSVVP